MGTKASLLFCHNGAKRRFEFREAAEGALEAIRRDPAALQRPKLPVRVYRCRHCEGFHLTSKPLKKGGS